MSYGVWINQTIMYFHADGIRRLVLRFTHREMTFIPHWIESSGWETVSMKVNLFVSSWALAYFSRTILLQFNLMGISPTMRRYMSASSHWMWWTRSRNWIIWHIQLMLQEIWLEMHRRRIMCCPVMWSCIRVWTLLRCSLRWWERIQKSICKLEGEIDHI